MCGWAGCWDLTGRDTGEALLANLEAMTGTLHHRGPDDHETWVDLSAGMGLGFRRLSILDLSPEGRQPMRSRSGRQMMVFNGEVYNHEDLREVLGGPWRGRSDSEVVLEAIERWGIAAAAERFRGMFALAVWDAETKSLHLARDPFGKKPLYYGWAGSTFLFGSELKALRIHPAFQDELDRDALGDFLRFAYIPSPRTIHRGIHKLPPGTILTLKNPTPGQLPEPAPFWDALREAEAALAHPFEGTFEDACDHLEGLLAEATRLRCVADVPLGAFLSGGIDSSLVVALMARQTTQPLRTFTIGFQEAGFDEAGHARAVAAHLGTHHTEAYVSPKEAQAVIPDLPRIYDEPFADPSEIPTFLLARITRPHVTVALSGDGGDEFFAGYDRYRVGLALTGRLGTLPDWARRALSAGCLGIPPRLWDATVTALLGPRFGSARLRRFGRAANSRSLWDVYAGVMTYWHAEGIPLRDHRVTPFPPSQHWMMEAHPIHQMMMVDTRTYLSDDILVKVDRASMANSLEVRNPLLDREVFRFAWRLPLAYTHHGGTGKRILRAILHRHVPPHLVDRPKMGFGIPLRAWLLGPLRAWAEDLLTPVRLDEMGLESAAIRRAWDALNRDAGQAPEPLWNVIVLQQWMRDRGRRP